jgi:drug/metabolite transporter (DMT)-like permease
MTKTGVILLAFSALIIGNLFATFVDVFVKLYADNVSIFQYLFLRQIAVVLFLLPFWSRLSSRERAPGKLKIHLFRALMTCIGAPCAVVALLYLSLATANVIFYAAPMLTLVLALLFFGEPIKIHRILVATLGLTGVIVALRPQDIGLASLLAFVTAFAIAAYNLSVKWLPKGTRTINTIFWANALALPVMAGFAAANWKPVNVDLAILCIGASLCLIAYQGCCIFAFRLADASAISVAEYSGLVFAALLGWWMFGEQLDQWTLLGISFIILPILWQSWHEHQREKARLARLVY